MKHISKEEWKQIFKIRDAFSKKLRGKPLYKKQKLFSNSIIKSVILQKGETLLSQWTRQRGKTTIVVDTVAFLINFYFPICKKFEIITTPFFNVGFFAPQEEQAKTDMKLLRETLHILKSLGMSYEYIEHSANTIHISKGLYPSRMIYAFTASPTSHPESKTLNLIILEESQDLIDQQINKAIMPMGASTNATNVWIGVSGYQKCQFWELRQKLPEANKIIVPYTESLKEDEELYALTKDPFYLNYRKHIEKRIREIGEESDEFRTQYAMEWMLEKGQFITYDDLLKLEADYVIEECYTKHMILYAGIDWGKMHDSTILTVVDDSGHLVGWHSWIGDDYSSQIEEIVFLLREKYLGVRHIWCDATGNQDMGVDTLRSEIRKTGMHCIIEGYKFSAQSKDYMYKNLSRLMKDKMMDKKVIEPSFFKFPSQKTMKQGGFTILDKERFIKQFCDLQKDIKNNLWHCAHPEGPNYHDDYCLSDDTKILTDKGFLGINELNNKDKIVSWNNGKLLYENPLRIIKKDYKGEMLYLNGEHFKAFITPEHKIGFERRTRKNKKELYVWDIKQAKDLLKIKTISTSRRFPVCGEIQNDEYNIKDEEIRLCGWMITEGWISKSKKWNDARYGLGQSLKVYPEKVKEIDNIVKTLNMSYNIYNRKDGLRYWQFRKIENERFEKLLLEGVHTIPRKYLSSFSVRQLKILFKSLMDGDGCWRSMSFATNNKRLRDDFQELCHKIGFGARIGKPYKGCYNIYVLKGIFRCVQRIETKKYNGKVWCVTVPSGFIVTKYKNVVSVLGNCDSLALACLAFNVVRSDYKPVYSLK